VNGQVKEAVLLLDQVVKIHKQTLAEDHPDRLSVAVYTGRSIPSEWTGEGGGVTAEAGG
jgi:hypothetical protein